MSEEDRIELKKELSIYSKEELLEKYIDELEENHILTNQWYKSSQRINRAREYIEHENFKRNILVGISTKKYTRDILNKLLEILGSDKE